MGEHPAVTGRLHRWGRHLRSAAAITVLAMGPLLTAAPGAAADPDTTTDDAGTHTVAVQDLTVRAPLPSSARGNDADTTVGGPASVTPLGYPVEITTFTLSGHPPVPEFWSTQAPASPPVGCGLSRAPPQRFTHLP